MKRAKGTLLEEYLSWHRQADMRRKWLTAETVKAARADFHRKYDSEEIEQQLSALRSGFKGEASQARATPPAAGTAALGLPPFPKYAGP